MIKANISNNITIHKGVFCINISIDHPISDLDINDFIFEGLSGNGMNNIELPDQLETHNVSRQTLCVILVELPDNVSGSIRVSIRDRQYTLDNTRYGISHEAVDVPDTEQHRIECIPKIFVYIGD